MAEIDSKAGVSETGIIGSQNAQKVSSDDAAAHSDQKKTPRRYNHAATIAFTVENEDPDGNLTQAEILNGILRRLMMLMENPTEFAECAETYDTYEVGERDRGEPEEL